MPAPTVFDVLETYYDTAPRAAARTEEVGPFTLFVRSTSDGWPYYARPRLGLEATFTPDAVAAVRERQRELDIPQAFEWVHETTPALLAVAREAGLHVAECPLLVLPRDRASTAAPAAAVSRLEPHAADLEDVLGAISVGFGGTNEVAPNASRQMRQVMRDGLVVLIGAYDEHGVAGGGSHIPRGETTELTGIAVLPRARRRGLGAAITHALVSDAKARGVETVFLSARDDAVARVYERVGFVRVGTACIGEPAEPGSDTSA